jgi:hypothetical protein
MSSFGMFEGFIDDIEMILVAFLACLRGAYRPPVH